MYSPKNPYFITTLVGLFFILINMSPGPVIAQQSGFYFEDNSPNVHIEKRAEHDDSMLIITTKEGSVELLMTDERIIIQFSKTGLNRVTEEIDRSEVDIEEFTLIYDVFKSMLSSGLRTLLNHSLQIPISELKEVSYENGKLKMVTQNNSILFEDVEIGGSFVIEDFTEDDALLFMREIEKRMP